MGRGVLRAASSHCRQGETSRRCDVTTGHRRGAMTGPGEKTGHLRGTPMRREETRWRTGRRSRRGGASHRPGMVTAGLGDSTLPPRTSGGTTSRPGGLVRHACRRAAAALAPALAPAPAAVAAAPCRRSRAPPRLGAATAGSTRAVEKAAEGRPRHPGAPSRAPGGQRPSATSVAAPRAPHNRRRRRRPVPC